MLRSPTVFRSLLATAVIGSLVSGATIVNATPCSPPPPGTILSSYRSPRAPKGVPAEPARSNGPCTGGDDDCGVPTVGTDGEQYQCVEYVRRFYRTQLQKDTSGEAWHGNAITYWDPAKIAGKGLVKFDNDMNASPPAPDDIIVFDQTAFTPVGHVAIVTSVTATTVNIIEQNTIYSACTGGTYTLVLSNDSKGWHIHPRTSASAPILGWLRAPQPNCTPTEPSGETTCNDDLDNDCNGKTDCADPACASDPVCQNTQSLALGRYCSAEDSPSLSVTSDLTIEAWIRVTFEGGGYMWLFGKVSSGGPHDQFSYGLSYHIRRDSRRVRFWTSKSSTGTPYVYGELALSLGVNEWHHLAAVYTASAGRVDIYLDGNKAGPIGRLPQSLPDLTQPFMVGAILDWSDGSPRVQNGFNGEIDELRVWNVARSAAQIKEAMTVQLSGQEPNLVGYWPLNGDISDRSTFHNDLLTPTGVPTFSNAIPFSH